MSASLTEKTNLPWYKQGWPWFLIALPATAVVAGIITLLIAIRTWDGLVVDDYYKEGRAIVQTIERTKRAAELGLVSDLKVTSETLEVRVSAKNPSDVPAIIHVTIMHPTRGGADQVLQFSGQGGVFRGALAPLSAGRWLFQVEDEARNWKMNGEAYIPTQTEIRIDPSAP